MNSLVIIFQQADRNSSGNATFDDLIAVIKVPINGNQN
jgi:hypothetical protein